MRREIAGLVVSLALAAGLAWPATGSAAVTIGAKLETLTPLAGAYNCDTPNCTLINSALGTANTAPGGLTSPVTGTITGFRVRTGTSPASDVSLRVVRGSGQTFTGAGTGSPVSQGANLTVLHPASLPIRAGDYIGLNCCSGDDGVTTTDVPGSGTFLGWGTVADVLLADGETRAADTDHQDNVLMMNADVEPTNTFTIDRAKLKKGKKAVLEVTVPNDGVLSSQAPKTKCKKLTCQAKTKPFSIAVTAGTAIKVAAKLTKAVRKAAAERGRYRFRVTLGYLPEFGSATAVQTTKKLKLKR